MLNRIEKLLKKCNKKKTRITLGLVISFLMSANLFAEGNEIKKLEDFSEIKEIFKGNKRIEKKLADGTKIIIRFADSRVIVAQNIGGVDRTFGISLKNLEKLKDSQVVYSNLVEALKTLKDSEENVKIENIFGGENKKFVFGTQLVQPDMTGINSGVIISYDQAQVINGLGVNNGVLYGNYGQTISRDDKMTKENSSSIGINNGVIESKKVGQYTELGLAINNGMIESNGTGQYASENSIGLNNKDINAYVGQRSDSNSLIINNGTIKSEARGQAIAGIGINLGNITTNTNTEYMASLGQEVQNFGVNYGTVNSEDGIAQYVDNSMGAVAINNGVLKGNEGQSIQNLGTVINNGIIIAERGHAANNDEHFGDFQRNGIVLKRENGKLVLNNGKFIANNNEKSYNEGIRIVKDKITVTDKVIIKNNNGNKIYGRKLFVNNLGTDTKTMDNHLIIDTNLIEKGYYGRDYRNTHITTAVAKDSTITTPVIEVDLKSGDNTSFTMDKSTIVGYFEKDGTLVDMIKNKNVTLNNSVISAVGEGNINPVAIKVNNGTKIELNNSVVNGKLVFENSNTENKENTLNLNSKYNGKDKKVYEDGTQFMTSVSDVEFKGKTNDTIVVKTENNSQLTTTDKNTKGFISIGDISFGEGNDNLKINFEDYKTGHLNVAGTIDFGSDEDKLEFSEKLDTTNDSLRSLVLLNNLLAHTKNLETLQLSNENNSVVVGENGISLEFAGTLKGGTGNDTFIVKGNNSAINNIDGGEGDNTLKLGRVEATDKINESQTYDSNSYVSINGNVSNFSTVDINTNIKLGEKASFSGIKDNILNLNNNSLILDINKNNKDSSGNIIGNALYNDKNKDIIFKDMNKIVFDVSDFNKNETILTNNSSIKDHKGKIQANSSVHDIVIGENGSIKVEVSENLPKPPVVEPEKPSVPDNTTPEGGTQKPSTPDNNIKPDEKPQADSNKVYELVPNYNYLNKVYQSVKSAGIDSMQKTTQLTEDSKEGIVSKTERESIMAQLEFYGKIFNSTPYAYSHKVSKKSAMAITDDILASDRKVNEKEWIFGGKILGENSDNKNEFNGKNLHGVDSADSEVKIDSHIYGAYAYGEYRIKENTVVGFAVGGTKSSTDISGNSKLKGNSAVLSTYAKRDIGNVELKAGLGYQYGEYDSKRTVSNAYQSMSANKDYNDNTFVLFSGVKYSHSLDKDLHIEPYFNISLSHVKQDSIKEKEDQPLTLDVKGKTFTAVDTETGVDLVKDIKLSKGNLKVKAGTSIMYAVDGYEKEYITGKINGASSDFQMVATESDRTKIKFKVSAEYEMENGISYSVSGNYRVSSNEKDYTVGMGIGYKF
ncbi:autotransporter outer membrane beta-barrel domain-containing protein [Fusobacterium sp.]|uniref:autotransporter outer membrane beta-barrel domain-containing protein n=1 Tax=Fusobacterium sp. TaxID=68766 RepID=UPI0025C48020|nr:autotransporter outer membrane beta-barrel domain-containing protein [Fusobacterium sp.]